MVRRHSRPGLRPQPRPRRAYLPVITPPARVLSSGPGRAPPPSEEFNFSETSQLLRITTTFPEEITPMPPTNSRDAAPLDPVPMTQLDAPTPDANDDWLWHGLIGRGNVTLFTSQWKAGKTTLLTGLMQRMAEAGTFLDRPVAAARVLFVSEESKATWADRVRRMPVGEHCRLLARPFPRRPTLEQ